MPRYDLTGSPAGHPLFPSFTSGSVVDLPTADTAAPATLTLTANQMYYFPISVPAKCVLGKIYAEVTTLGASSVLRAGLYSGSAGPVTLLGDYGTQAASSTGLKAWSMSTSLDPNTIYWVTFGAQTAGCGVRSMTFYRAPMVYNKATDPPTASDLSAARPGSFWTNTSISGALAGSPALSLWGLNQGPRLLLKLT